MAKLFSGASIFCKDCGDQSIATGDARIGIFDLATKVSVISGEIFQKSANHHQRLKKGGREAHKYPLHNEMTLLFGGRVLGTFITSSHASAVAITVQDTELRKFLDDELRQMMIAKENERRRRKED